MMLPPKLPGLLGQMSCDIQEAGLAPGLVDLCLTGVASQLTQGVADVEGPMGISPVGIPCAGVYPPGVGKTSCLNLLMKPLISALSEMPASMNGFLLEDATREAVVDSLKECRVAGLFTDEGGQLERMLGTSAPTFAKLIDGSDIRHARVGNKSKDDRDLRVSIINPRFNVFLLVQPDVFEQGLKPKLGAGVGGQGLANRIMWNDSPSHRLNSTRSLGLREVTKRAYTERTEILLNQTYEHIANHKKPRPVIRLSPEAQAHFQWLRSAEFPGAAKEYAVRHAQRALRLAAALHIFEHGPSGFIGLEDLQIAQEFDQASIASFSRLTSIPVKLTQAELDAQTLIREFSRWAPNSSVKVADLRRYAPNFGMTKSRFNQALPLICGAGLALVQVHEGCEYLQVSHRLWWNQAMPTHGLISAM